MACCTSSKAALSSDVHVCASVARERGGKGGVAPAAKAVTPCVHVVKTTATATTTRRTSRTKNKCNKGRDDDSIMITDHTTTKDTRRDAMMLTVMFPSLSLSRSLSVIASQNLSLLITKTTSHTQTLARAGSLVAHTNTS